LRYSIVTVATVTPVLVAVATVFMAVAVMFVAVATTVPMLLTSAA